MTNKLRTSPIVAVPCILFSCVLASRAALNASDNAGNYSSWPGENHGTGFGNWSFSDNSTGGHGAFLSTASGADQTGSQINDGGKSWALFANNGGIQNAVRPFTSGNLATGQQFVIQMDNGYIEAGGSVGFGLQNSSGGDRFAFYFRNGTANYQYWANGVEHDTGLAYTTAGLTITFSQQSGNNFHVDINRFAGGSAGFDGTLASADISQVRFFNANAGDNSDHNAYFNDISVVPEPTHIALGIFGGLMGAGTLLRRWRLVRQTV